MSLQPRTQSVRPMTNVKVASIRSDVIQNKNDGQTQDDVTKDSNATYDQSCMDKASDVIQSQQKHDILNDSCDDNEEGEFEEKHVRKKTCFDFSEADLTNDLTVDENMMIDVLSLRREINKNCDHCAESFDASISAHVTKDRNTVRKKTSSPNTMKRRRVDIFGTAVDDTRNAALSSAMDTNTTAQANRKNTNTNSPADEVKHNISTQADGVFISTNAQADGVNLCTTAEAHGGIANTNAQAHREMPNKNAREHGVITNTNAREHQVVTNTNAREHQVVTNTQAQTDGVFTNPYAQADGVFGNDKAQADGVITNTNAPVDQAFINRNAQTGQVFTNKNAQSDQVFTGENAQADEVFTKTTAQADQVFTHLNAQAAGSSTLLANKTAQEDGVITNTNVQADETLTNPNARTNDTFTNPNAQVDDVFTNPNAQADEVLTNTNAQADAVFTCCPFSLPERLNTQAKKEHSNTNARAMEMDTNINSTVDFKFAALTDASARKKQETTCCENCRSHVVQCAIFIVSSTGMTLCVALYCVIGAVVFTQLEGKGVTPESIPSIQMRICKRLQKEIPIPVDLNLTEKERECNNATNAVLENFGKRLTDILSSPSFDQWGRTKWTFSGSLLFVVTVVTTIGYGTIAPVTAAGRVWTMMLGLLGIPITLLWVTNAGDYLAITTRFLYAQGFCRLCIGKGNSADSGDQHEVPVFVCLALIVSYLLLGAYLFHKWEGWTFEDSFYFCFMTLSTIGFGDFVPGFDDENMNDIETTQKQLLCMGYVLFGVALLAMVFQLMKDACWRAFHGCQQCCGCRTTDSMQDAELERAFQNAVKAQIALRLMLSVTTPVTNSSVSSRPREGTSKDTNEKLTHACSQTVLFPMRKGHRADIGPTLA